MKKKTNNDYIIDSFEIVDTVNGKSSILDKNKISYNLMFSLENYRSPIELVKLPSRNGINEFSLRQFPDSKYKYGGTYTFKIKSHKTTSINGVVKEMWELEDDDKISFIVFIRKVDVYNHSINQEIKCQVVKIFPNKIFLKFVSNTKLNFVPGLEYKFKLIDAKISTGSRTDFSNLLVQDHKGNHYEISGPSWQKEHSDSIKDIYCKYSPIENKLLQSFCKQQHPYFQQKQLYEFIFKNEIENNYNTLLVLGPDRCQYVIKRPFIYYNKQIPPDSKLKLVYIGLNEQYGSLKTKYFVSFEDIIQNFRALKRITFDAFRKNLIDGDDDPLLQKMFSDYDNFENLWVISFCEILRKKIDASLYDLDYETALIFIDVLLQIEEWILNSGFLTSFSIQKREITSKVAFTEIDSLRKEYKALELILDNKDLEFISNFSPDNIGESLFNAEIIRNIYILFYIYKHKKYYDRDYIQNLINTINGLGARNIFKTEKGIAVLVIEILEELKNKFEKDLFYGVFINSEKRRNYFANNVSLLDYIRLTFTTLLLSLDLENRKSIFFLFIRALKLVSLYENCLEKQNKIINIALNLSSHRIDSIIDIIKDNYTWSNSSDIKDILSKTLPNNKIRKFNNLIEIERSFNEASSLQVKVIGNSWIGYEVVYNEDSLFLPFFSSPRQLKKGEVIDVIVYLLDKQFNHALVRTVLDLSVISENQVIETGATVKGLVKRIEDYGVFVNLGEQDGLIPKREICNQFIAHPEDILNIGDIIEAKVISIDTDGEIKKLSLSRKEVLKEKIKSIRLEAGRYEGVITNIVEEYGIFIELPTGHSGLIRREEILWNEVEKINDLFSRGDRISVDFLNNTKDKNFFSLISDKSDPFKEQKLIGKSFNSKIIGFYDLNQWLEFWSIEDTPHVNFENDTISTYCPFCYEKSPFKTNKETTAERTIIADSSKKMWSCCNCKYISLKLSKYIFRKFKV